MPTKISSPKATKPKAAYGIREARVDLAAAHRLAVMDNLHEGTWNHFSVTVPGILEEILLTPGDRHWSQVTASSLVVAASNAKKIETEGGFLWVGYRIHYPIHKARPDAVCVLHTHSPYATALSMLEGGRLLMAEQNALNFYGKVAYNDIYEGQVGGGHSGLSLGEQLAEALGDKTVLILKNHGVVVVGPSVAAAYFDLYLLERACQFQVLAWSTGQKLQLVPDEILKGLNDDNQPYKVGHFAAMKRVLDREQPDYQK
jgi:ribulose-5-phosphate 4-epimerase/fuculose-1-phosphate aldolase